jgi:hypothetical protein
MYHLGRWVAAHPGFEMIDIGPREPCSLSKLALREAMLLAKTCYQPGKIITSNSLLLLPCAIFC